MKRRSLLKTALLGSLVPSVGWALPRLDLQALNEPFDVVIVGAGAAGLTAACAAADAGLKRIAVFEKEPILGGASIRCEGCWSLSGTSFQEQLGIRDSAGSLEKSLIEIGRGANEKSIVRAYAENALRQYDWICSLGLEPSELISTSGTSVPRGHRFDPRKLFSKLEDYARQRGVLFFTNAKATKLHQASDCSVCGVRVEIAGQTYDVKSRAGVLLSTGGFSRNEAWISRYAPKMTKVAKLSAPGATGDGHILALSLGAQLRDMGNIRAAFGFIPNPSTVDDISQIIYAGAIIVNAAAQRFVDESLPYKDIGEIALNQPNQSCFIVFDETIRLQQMQNRAAERRLWEGIDLGQVPDYVYRGQTFSEVATLAGLNVESLHRTIARYNEFVKLGVDKDFGRAALNSNYGRLKPISKPPFYVVPSVCGMMGTNCGILVDASSRVLDQSGRPIKGLYAAGEITGGFHGLGFMGGTSYGKALVFGRLAAESIVQETKQ